MIRINKDDIERAFYDACLLLSASAPSGYCLTSIDLQKAFLDLRKQIVVMKDTKDPKRYGFIKSKNKARIIEVGGGETESESDNNLMIF